MQITNAPLLTLREQNRGILQEYVLMFNHAVHQEVELVGLLIIHH